MKLCIQCEKEFNPTSRHARCPQCRYSNSKKLCACGASIAGRSVQCITCLGLSQRGEASPTWAGGTTYHKKGYVMCITDGKYIFEHRLVMQEHLGRELLPTENVHHKNGVKTDNRIENLELWTRNQPAGQRVSDLIEYANQIIELYGDNPDKFRVE